PPKPIWRRRADRKEIGWYGFAAQEGCTCITGWVLPLIGQHCTRRRDPAHSVTPRQHRYLAVRGSSNMLDHPAFLSWRRRTGCHTSVSPTGDRGFESCFLQRRVCEPPVPQLAPRDHVRRHLPAIAGPPR